MKFLLFSGEFKTHEEARKYCLPWWEDEPSTEDSEKYWLWECRNPIWPMRDALGVSLDSDFVEINFDILGVTSQITCSSEQLLRQRFLRDSNTFILLFEHAFMHSRFPVIAQGGGLGALRFLGQFE